MNHIIKLLCFAILAVFCFANTVNAQIPIEAFGNIPNTSLMTISPSGKYIGFRKKSPTKDVYMVFSIEENKIIGSVDVGDSKPSKAYFVKDDQIILVVGKYQQTGSFYGSSAQHSTYALSYNIQANTLHRLLVPGERIFDNQWGLGRIIGISSDGEYAYMPAYNNGFEYTLMKARLSAKRMPTKFVTGSDISRDFFVDDKDNPIARIEYDNRENIFTIQKRENKKWINIFQEERRIPFSIKGVTPDRKSLVIGKYIRKKGNKNLAYFTMSLSDGEVSEEPIFYRQDASVESEITDINRVIYGVKYSGFLPKYKFFDDKLTKRLEKISKSFANTAIHLKDWSDDWKHLLVFIEGQESSGEYIIVNESNEMNIVGMARPLIPYTSVHPISIFNYKAADGLKIPALLTKPKSWDGKTKLPTVMLPHGGPESYDRIGFDWLAQYFAEQGYLVIQPQFRGSEGFGLDHKNAGRGEWGKKMQSDLADALARVVKKGYADPERVCIVGASYGGYAALAAGAFTPNLYNCIVSINGVSDIDMMLSKKKIKYGKHHWALAYWNKIILKKDDEKSLFEEISPINHADKFTSPVLLIHSENDGTVSFAQSSNMYDELQDNDKDSTLIELDKDDHYLSYTETRLQALTEISTFIKKHI